MYDSEYAYQSDLLGPEYQKLILNLPNDADGKVIATLVRKKADQATQKAVLYIHGFLDYFFQKEMAEQFNQHGYDFYALDLRKYGRSILPKQKAYDVRDLKEYEVEISQALNIIGGEGHTRVLLSGHSTGGLISTLFAVHHPHHPLLAALWCNSPFYDFNMHPLKKKHALPKLSALGKYAPNLKFPSELNKFYTPSLHCDFHGEWRFNLDWKPKSYPLVRLSFVHAIFEAQKEIHQGPRLTIPALIMHSDRTTYPKKYNQDAQSSDVILCVDDIKKHANTLQGNVDVMTIKGGLHDLVLSKPPVRALVYQQLFAWLAKKID